MATITASLSARVDARGKSEILLRFVSGRDHIYRVRSRLFIQPSRWKDGAVVIPRLETDEQRALKDVRDKLDALEKFLLDEFSAADPAAVSRRWLQDAVERFHHPDGSAGLDVVRLFREFRDSRDISDYRVRHYGVVIRSLERFQEYRGKALTVGGVDASVLQEYREFLTDEYVIARKKRWRALYATGERPPEPRGHNTVVDFLKIVRAFYNWLRRTGRTKADPFATFEVGSATYGTPWYITIGEREKLYRTNLRRHPALAAQRDVFVFQCLVGCRVGDLLALKKWTAWARTSSAPRSPSSGSTTWRTTPRTRRRRRRTSWRWSAGSATSRRSWRSPASRASCSPGSACLSPKGWRE